MQKKKKLRTRFWSSEFVLSPPALPGPLLECQFYPRYPQRIERKAMRGIKDPSGHDKYEALMKRTRFLEKMLYPVSSHNYVHEVSNDE